MKAKIEIGSPVYLEGLHYNIPMKRSWNESLLAGLQEISREIEGAKPPADIHGISITRIDEMAEFKAQGDIGYSFPSAENRPTDYYYIDFLVIEDEEHDGWYNNERYFKALNKTLNEYLDSNKGYRLSGSEYGTNTNEEDRLALRLRAYFIQTPDKK